MRIEWEHDLVERPFCEQLKAMGGDWIEVDDFPAFILVDDKGNDFFAQLT